MIKLPFADPGTPDTRSPVRFLVWVGRQQLGTLLAGVFFGVLWMVSQALMPAAIGRAIQDGIVDDDSRALAIWALILLGLGATTAAAGVMRHRCAVSNWLQASFRMAQVVAHHAARTGHAIKKEHSTGEVVATVGRSTSPRGSPGRSSRTSSSRSSCSPRR
jgi:ABC-type multidrug transport system fused ATPase/permease subunit